MLNEQMNEQPNWERYTMHYLFGLLARNANDVFSPYLDNLTLCRLFRLSTLSPVSIDGRREHCCSREMNRFGIDRSMLPFGENQALEGAK